MDGLIVNQPFANLIINKKKIWEIRNRIVPKNKIQQEILLLSRGSMLGKIIINECFLIDYDTFFHNTHKHKCIITEDYDLDYIYAWNITVIEKFSNPKRYTHPIGARVWVKNVNTIKQKTILSFANS